MSDTCDYCGSREPKVERIKCGACKKTYRGSFCNECQDHIKTQSFCTGKDASWFAVSL